MAGAKRSDANQTNPTIRRMADLLRKGNLILRFWKDSSNQKVASGQAVEVGQSPFIRLVHQRTGEQEIGRGAIAGDRDVIDDGQAQQRLDVDVVWMRGEGIPEEDDEVDSPVGDGGADLLIAAQRTASKPGDGETER